MSGFVCYVPVYEYKGWMFEMSMRSGPWPLRKNGELRRRAGRKFFAVASEFAKLTDEQKKACRVGGGGVRF
jgi:hypothetical protein